MVSKQRNMNTRSRSVLVTLLAICVHGCAGPQTVPTASAGVSAASGATVSSAEEQRGSKGEYVPAIVGGPPDPGPERTFRIGPYDLLKIEVFQVPELSSQLRVNEDGFVAMPLIGNVKVGGLTPQQAEQAISAKLGEDYLQHPQVSIFVAEYASQKLTGIGQLQKPGVFPVAGRTTLMQAIALAGGLGDVADKEEIIVFRKQPQGNVTAYVVDMASIEDGKLADPVIVGDDRIVVPKSGSAVLTKAIGNVLTGWAIRGPFY